MKKINLVKTISKASIMACMALLAVNSDVNAQTTTTVYPGTFVHKIGPAIDLPAGQFINDGTYTDTISSGVLQVDGGITFYGSGTTTLYNMAFINGGSSVLYALVSVYSTATIDAGTTVDANNNLWIRSDLKPGANLVVHGVLTGTVRGIIADATATTGTSPYTSTLSVNVSGTVVQYQWEASTDNATWLPVTGANSDTYNATVTATTYYRCVTTTINSTFTSATPGLKLSMDGAATAVHGFSNSNGISIFPNPTAGNISIKGTNFVNIRVLDMAGRLIKYTGHANNINISEFPAGSYIVKLFNDGGDVVFTGKVVKE